MVFRMPTTSLLPLVMLLALDAPATSRPDDAGFIRDWLLLGPLYYDPLWPAGEPELDRASLPREPALAPRPGQAAMLGGKALAWTAHHAGDAVVDLAAATHTTDTRFAYGYAVAYLVTERAMPDARLRLGSNDLAKVWVNGRQVIRTTRVGNLVKDRDGAVVPLKKGVNVVVVKAVNDEGAWQLAARLVAPGGAPLRDVFVALRPDGAGERTRPDAEGFVRDWLVLGAATYQPRPYAQGQVARQQIAGEASLRAREGELVWAAGQPLKWHHYRAPTSVIDFNQYALTTAKDTVPPYRWEPNKTIFNPLGYAATYVTAPRDLRDLTVKIGVNDQGRLYIDGKPVVEWDHPGALVKDVAGARVSLSKGVHRLVFKVINAGDNWQGCVRFVDGAGRPVTDLEVSTTPPPTPEELAARD